MVAQTDKGFQLYPTPFSTHEPSSTRHSIEK